MLLLFVCYDCGLCFLLLIIAVTILWYFCSEFSLCYLLCFWDMLDDVFVISITIIRIIIIARLIIKTTWILSTSIIIITIRSIATVRHLWLRIILLLLWCRLWLHPLRSSWPALSPCQGGWHHFAGVVDAIVHVLLLGVVLK